MILSDKIHQTIQETYNKLFSEGKIVSISQLDKYYETFRERFGIQKLKSLDGEMLLETMHNSSNQDSLVYWLEYKNDEEFPSINFGSIAGGSALKFGIYKRKETGAWMTGSPVNSWVLSTDEAIEIARKHRDQLVAGVNILSGFPAVGTDDNYRGLQEQMDKIAPDVSNSAWGHKYFHLIYPDKLDDFHSPYYQRFYLIKLQQIPPGEDGRYVCAGRYMAIAKEFDLPVHMFTFILNDAFPRPHRYWRIGTKLGGVNSIWELMKEEQSIAVGWTEISSLNDIAYNKESKEKIRAAMEKNNPGKPPQTIGRQTQQLFNYVAVIAEGDIVLPSDGVKVLGIGRVSGGYSYVPKSDAPHRRQVEWLSFNEWPMPIPEGLQTTVTEVKKHENLIKVEQVLIQSTPPQIAPPTDKHKVEVIKMAALSGIQGRIQSILERKGQVIIYGPPGTGKTYWAELTARELAARSNFGMTFTQLSADQKLSIIGSDKEKNGTVRICCFHPAYGYEDFLEGYRPEESNGAMVYKLRDGVFKRICEDAKSNQNINFYLLIDEINRGDIPRIFGELLMVLEINKRNKPIILPLSGTSFQVPDNLFVIGTMNTADRSIALLDTALRRRFGFIELMPDSTVLGDIVLEGIPLGPWLDALNRRICEHIGRDARNLQIGHSYLLDGSHPVSDFVKFSKVIREDIIPLLEEYCYEDYSILENILGKGLVDTNKQVIRHDLFDTLQKDKLIQSLLAPCPDIAATPQAIMADSGIPEVEIDTTTDEQSIQENLQ